MAIMEKDLKNGQLKAQAARDVAEQVSQLLDFLSTQQEKLAKLDNMMEIIKRTEEKPLSGPRRQLVVEKVPYLDLAKALYLINENRDRNRRITWRNVEDSKQLVFAYLRRAEMDGINIEKSTEMQAIPTYRRVFQYVVYNIGPWKEIIEEFRNQESDKPAEFELVH
jgi:hypothetical protein